MGPLSAAGMGIGLIGGIGQYFGSKKADKTLEELIKQSPQYQTNPIAKQRLALAQQLLNARMPGAASIERNIYGNQANILSNVERNATDGSQALAIASAVQGQTNQSFQDLGIQEGQDYYNRLQNLTGAQEGMISEGDKIYQDQIRRYEDLAKIRGAQNQNRQNRWQGVSNFGQSVTNVGQASEQALLSAFTGGMGGGMGGLMKK